MLVRTLALTGVPLIITNDGAGYVSWALDLLDGRAVDWPTFRTPGYPMFLVLIFRGLGTGGLQVLIVQHVLGVLSAVMLAHMMLRWVRPALSARNPRVFRAARPVPPLQRAVLTSVLGRVVHVSGTSHGVVSRTPLLDRRRAADGGAGLTRLLDPSASVRRAVEQVGTLIAQVVAPRRERYKDRIEALPTSDPGV